MASAFAEQCSTSLEVLAKMPWRQLIAKDEMKSNNIIITLFWFNLIPETSAEVLVQMSVHL